MKNFLVETLRNLIRGVDNGTLSSEHALEKFCFMFNGINYIPRYPKSKKRRVIEHLENGIEPAEIAKIMKIQKGYVYRIRKKTTNNE